MRFSLVLLAISVSAAYAQQRCKDITGKFSIIGGKFDGKELSCDKKVAKKKKKWCKVQDAMKNCPETCETCPKETGVHHWYNWQKDKVGAADGVYIPKDEIALQQWMATKHKSGAYIKVVGNGHVFGDITTCVNTTSVKRESWIVKMDNFLDIQVDLENNLATFGSGWGLDDVVKYLERPEYNRTVFNTGTERVQNFVGAFSTGTHGTGGTKQIMAGSVKEINALAANGEPYVISAAENNLGARVGLGALGIITSVTIEIKEIEYYKRTDIGVKSSNIAEFYDEIMEMAPKYDRFQVKDLEWNYDTETKMWVPSDNARVTFWEKVDRHLDDYVKNCTTITMCCGKCYPSICYDDEPNAIAASIQGHECGPSFFAEFEHIAPVKGYDESTALLNEYANWFNRIDMDPVFRKFAPWGDTGNIALRNPELRFVAKDDIWMSMANSYGIEDESVFFVIINVDLKMPFSDWEVLEHYQEFLATFIPEFGERYNVRPHWGKQATFDFNYTKIAYPMVDTFKALRREKDPLCQFVNDALMRFLGLEGECPQLRS